MTAELYTEEYAHNKIMPTSFYTHVGNRALCVLDLVDYYSAGKIITRINVPVALRSQGYGSQLLRRCCQAADDSSTPLFLEVASYGAMTNDDLVAWYSRHGFSHWLGMMYRPPKSGGNA